MKRNIISLSWGKKLSQPQSTFFDFDWSVINSTLSEERRTFTDVFTKKNSRIHSKI